MIYRFKVSDLIYYGWVNRETIEKIERFHLPFLNQWAEYITEVVGYRSRDYEIAMRRSGNSQHTFQGNGAVDISTNNPLKLFDLLVESPYTRVAYYPYKKFFHVDYASNMKTFYLSTADSKWTRAQEVELRKKIEEAGNGYVV